MAINFIGEALINLTSTFKYIFKGRINTKNVLAQSAIIGYDSAPIALIICFVVGCIFSLQISKYFVLSGAESYVGGLIAVAMVREMAPIFASLTIGARAGTAIAAEIGNMKVTEQIDALKTLKVDPIEYLFVPRILAGLIMLPLVTILSEFVGTLGGMFIADMAVNLHPSRYLDSVWLYLSGKDITISILKACVFGVLLTIICATHGIKTRGGAKEVGVSTNKAAIWTALAILLFDYFITWIFYS